MINQTISHYTITDKLGEGGMGVVYKARDTKLERDVALKFLPQHLTSSEEDRQRFIREAKAAAALNHPNICTIHSVEEYNGKQFISMEHIDGQTLQNKLDTHSLTLKTAVEYAVQIADALAKAHGRGIVHRDIKPSNIMIDEDGRIKVMDFGLARMKGTEGLTQAGTTVGTLRYMSPEQVRGEAVDHRSDLFSFGVVLYEILAGHRPFRGEHQAATLYSIANEDPPPLKEVKPDIPQKLSDIVEKLLQKEPVRRYQSTDRLSEDLKACLNELSGTTESLSKPNNRPEEPSLTADGRKESSDSDSTSITINLPSLNSRTGMVSLAAGLSLLVLIGYGLYSLSGSPELPSDNTLAVLPLESVSQDPEDVQFTDGIHEELINRLAGIGELAVIARSSVLNYPPENRDLQTIAEELGVSSLMEGTVRRAGDRLRVSVQLINVDNLTTLWSNSYDEHFYDVFEIQSRIAREVAGELQATLSPVERQRLEERPTESPQAYNFYMQAREYLSRSKYQANYLITAEQLLRRALEEDPQFPHAWAMLGVAYSDLYWFHGHTPERLDQMREAAERAQLLAPDLPETKLALGLYNYWLNPDPEQTLAYFESALQEFPNHPELHLFTAQTHRRLGNWDQVETHFKKAVELDPRNTNHYGELSYYYYLIRDYDKALEYSDRLIELLPDAPPLLRGMQALYVLRRDATFDGYENWRKEIHPLDPVEIAPFWWGYQYYWNKRNWEKALRSVKSIQGEIVMETETAYWLRDYFKAKIYDRLGEPATALEYYEQLRLHLESLTQEHPDDPRYRVELGKVYARMGKTEEAIREGVLATELMPFDNNAFEGAWFEWQLAYIYTWSGYADEAIDLLEHQLSIPSIVSRNSLRNDPDWDPLRDHPRFRELIAETDESG